MQLVNRVVVSPMAQYKAKDGCPNDWHLMHLGARAAGGAGLVYTEMTCTSAQGRITPGCPGLYAPEHEAAWRRIVDFVHAETPAKICCQIGHAGRKASTQLGWEDADRPLPSGNWPIIGPSPLPWSPENAVPHEMTRADMHAVTAEYAAATAMASRAGFDMVELHAAHGYLVSSFISPASNRRTDGYGGSLENRMRWPLEVMSAMRAAWGEDRPMSVRISATDWLGDDGVRPDEAVKIAAMFAMAGADIIDVSAGQTSTAARPVYGRMFQTPFSDRIRNEAGISTMAVGNITEADQVNSILLAGRADLVCLARPHLANPNWTLHAAVEAGDGETVWPLPWLAGREQMQRLRARASEAIRA
jgi:anthraniloyl-CoA monooxygenase